MKKQIKEQASQGGLVLEEAYVDESKIPKAAILLKSLMASSADETRHLDSSIINFKKTIEGLIIIGQAIAAAPTVSIESEAFSKLCREPGVAAATTGIFESWFMSEPRLVRPLQQALEMYSAEVGAPVDPQNPDQNVYLNPTVRESALQESRKRLQRNAGIKDNKVEENMFAKWKAYKAR